MKKKLREQVYQKYDGLCAYSGTPLDDDWQVDHLVSKKEAEYWGYEHSNGFNVNHIDNLVPAQRIINHYKRSLSLEGFRDRVANLSKRLGQMPKNPKLEHSIKRKEYLFKVASYFGITEDKKFEGKFYFEKLKN